MAIKTQINHFTQKELACRCCGVFNMADYHLSNLETLRIAYNSALFPSSGCRCKKHNKAVGGAKTSRHECTSKKADATDLQPKFKAVAGASKANSFSNEEDFLNEVFRLYELAKAMKVFKEVILYINIKNIEDSFVHVSSYPDKKIAYKHIKLRR